MKLAKSNRKIRYKVGVIVIITMLLTLTSAPSAAVVQYLPPVPPEPIIIRETPITVFYVEPQRVVTINVTQFDPLQVVRELQITFIEPVLTVILTIYHLEQRPPEVPEPKDVALLYFTIRAHKALLEIVEKANITFVVERAVVEEKGVDVETIVLNGFFEGVWQSLPTEKIAEDEVFLYFEAESPGLSHFVATGVAVPPPFPWWIIAIIVIVMVVVAAAIVICLYRRRIAKVGELGVSDRGEFRSKELLAGVVLTIVLASYLLCLHEYKEWLEGARQFFGWILGPEINYRPIPLEGLSYAIIGALQMLALGALLTHLLLPDEEDLWVRWLTMLGVGTGSTAIITAILGLLQILYNLWLNLAVLVAIFALVALSYRKWGKEWLARFAKYWKIPHLTINYKALAPTIGIGVIVFFIFYHAVLTPIDHFDALIYHAGMAKVMFHYHGIPLIAGPGSGTLNKTFLPSERIPSRFRNS